MIKVKIFFCELDSIFVHDATFCFCLNLIVPLQRGDTCRVKELVPTAAAVRPSLDWYLIFLFWKSDKLVQGSWTSWDFFTIAKYHKITDFSMFQLVLNWLSFDLYMGA